MTTHTDAELRHLAEQHRQRIRQSSIAPEVALARGYRSIDIKAELRRLGFTDAQCRVPALLLPVWSVFGEIGNYQLRADRTAHRSARQAGQVRTAPRHPDAPRRPSRYPGAARQSADPALDHRGHLQSRCRHLGGPVLHRPPGGLELAGHQRARRQDRAPRLGADRAQRPSGLSRLRLRRDDQARGLCRAGPSRRLPDEPRGAGPLRLSAIRTGRDQGRAR